MKGIPGTDGNYFTNDPVTWAQIEWEARQEVFRNRLLDQARALKEENDARQRVRDPRVTMQEFVDTVGPMQASTHWVKVVTAAGVYVAWEVDDYQVTERDGFMCLKWVSEPQARTVLTSDGCLKHWKELPTRHELLPWLRSVSYGLGDNPSALVLEISGEPLLAPSPQRALKAFERVRMVNALPQIAGDREFRSGRLIASNGRSFAWIWVDDTCLLWVAIADGNDRTDELHLQAAELVGRLLLGEEPG